MGGVFWFCVPPFLSACAGLGKECVILEIPWFLLTNKSLVEGLGLTGMWLTLLGLIYAISQMRAAQQLLELRTETRLITYSRDILEQFERNVAGRKKPPDAIYFLANTIAIGATAKGANFMAYRQFLERLLCQLGAKFSLAYVEILSAPGANPPHIHEDSAKKLRDFYERAGNISKERISEIISETYQIHRIVENCKARYFSQKEADSDGPHFILINPDKTDRFGIIWNIRKSGGEIGEVVTVGVCTKNKHFIKTMKSIFIERTSQK